MTERPSIDQFDSADLFRRVKLVARFFPIERIGVIAPATGREFRIFVNAKGLEDSQ